MKPSEKLSRLLDARGISQNELARRSGFAQSRVNGWINGKSRLFADQAYRICKALSVSTDWLLNEDDDGALPDAPNAWEMRISEIVAAIGPERAWRRLVGAHDLREAAGVDAGPDYSKTVSREVPPDDLTRFGGIDAGPDGPPPKRNTA